MRNDRALGAVALGLFVGTLPSWAQSGPSAHASRCEGTRTAGQDAPTPCDPYPLQAAGWGPEAGQGRRVSRWAEDWSGLRTEGKAPGFKAIPLGGQSSLTLSAEARFRYEEVAQGQLTPGNDYGQGLFRGVLGADLKLNPHLRGYAEIGTGGVTGRRSASIASYHNEASLQQLFLEIRQCLGPVLLGAMMGRQEFSDGPRQLLSLSDGPNLHRTWNGARLFAHAPHWRIGAFDFRSTRLKMGALDDGITFGERLRGANASLNLTPGGGPNTYLDPFWIHSEKPDFRSGGRSGSDRRDTFGLRLWGRRGAWKYDWTVAHQSGQFLDRRIEAWGVFAVQSLTLASRGWKPTLTSHLDYASGGGAYTPGVLRGFNPLYAASGYLGEGQFLSLSNLVLFAPGLSMSPREGLRISMEWEWARRLQASDAVYAGGMKAYAGTQNLPGRDIGTIHRLWATWSGTEHLSVVGAIEHFETGDLLKRAHRPSGRFAYVALTLRY